MLAPFSVITIKKATWAIKYFQSAALPRYVAVNWTASHALALLLAERATASRRKVPTMTNLSDLTALLVDPSEQTGAEYRKSFINAGADAHVVKNFSAAEKLVETKKIDAALIHYAQDVQTVSFCRLLYLKNIPCIFTAEPPQRYPTRKPMAEALATVRAILSRVDLPGSNPFRCSSQC